MPSSRIQVQVTIITDYEAGEFGAEAQADLLKSFKTAGLPAPQVTLSNGETQPSQITEPVPALPPPAQPPPSPAVTAEPAKPRRGRPVKTAPVPSPVEDTGLADTDDPVPDLNGPVDQDQDDDGDALGLTAPSMTGQDALESGLGKVRVMYAAGHKAPVKALQQQFKVASFQDIPPTDGHKFLATVIKLEEQLGLRV